MTKSSRDDFFKSETIDLARKLSFVHFCVIESDGGLNLLRSDSYFSLLAVIHFLVDMLGVFGVKSDDKFVSSH